MAITGMFFSSAWAFGGDNGFSESVSIGFGPSFAAALTTLTEATGDGLVEIGISQFSFRPPGAATDTFVNHGPFDFGGNAAIPGVSNPNMTSATATVTVGGNGQLGAGTLSVWFFA
jgi:hypothetical protein